MWKEKKKTGEDEEMNGVNWCEERMQRLEFGGGRQSEAVVVTAVAEQQNEKENVQYLVVLTFQ